MSVTIRDRRVDSFWIFVILGVVGAFTPAPVLSIAFWLESGNLGYGILSVVVVLLGLGLLGWRVERTGSHSMGWVWAGLAWAAAFGGAAYLAVEAWANSLPDPPGVLLVAATTAIYVLTSGAIAGATNLVARRWLLRDQRS